jgi:hypothetical protein
MLQLREYHVTKGEGAEACKINLEKGKDVLQITILAE